MWGGGPRAGRPRDGALPAPTPQAVMASDFAVPRFRFLQRLLIVHGHWCYTRLASMALYFFYKNTVRGAGASKVLRLGGRACADRQVQRSPERLRARGGLRA